jgi:hypothetical protein
VKLSRKENLFWDLLSLSYRKLRWNQDLKR